MCWAFTFKIPAMLAPLNGLRSPASSSCASQVK